MRHHVTLQQKYTSINFFAHLADEVCQRHHSFYYFVGMNFSAWSIWAMGLKSKFSDVHIPQDLSWPQFVFQNFEANGNKTAIVSEVFKFLTLNLFALVYGIDVYSSPL